MTSTRLVKTRAKCNIVTTCLTAALLAIGTGLPLDGRAAIESHPIQFAKGTSSATIKATLKGDQTVDYKLRAKAGQTMQVSMKTSNASSYFNVLPPGSKGEAIFNGSTDGNDWTGALPRDGEYTVREASSSSLQLPRCTVSLMKFLLPRSHLYGRLILTGLPKPW